MNWWNVLGIPYNSNLKTIKKAYSKLLKIYSPEDDADGYQRLREAYDQAVKYAKRMNKTQNNQEIVGDTYTKEDIVETEFIQKIGDNKDDENQSSKSVVGVHPDYVNNDVDRTQNEYDKTKVKINSNMNDICYKEQRINLNDQIKQFLSRLNEIYSDISLRTNIKAWKELLNSDVMWNAYSFPIIEDEMLKFLMNHKYLPSDVWAMLNNNFNWTKNEIKLYEKYSTSSIDELVKNLRNPTKLNFENFKSLDSEVVDKYFYEKEQEQKAINDRNEEYKNKENSFSIGDVFKLIVYIGIIISVVSHGLGHISQNIPINDSNKTVINQDIIPNSADTHKIGDSKDVQDNGNIKICKTAQGFKSTDLRTINLVRLTNIIALDLYCVKGSTNGTCNFYSKQEMDGKNKWNENWIQAYSGTIDDLNIMFIDKKFSKSSLEFDGGYTVKGSKQINSAEEFTDVATKNNKNISKVRIYQYYIDNFSN